MPSLDGLRCPALLCVLLSHQLMHVPDVPGRWWLSHAAFLSVSLFFCLSGYLITSLLLDEYENTGRIDLRGFFIRRFFRIVPPYYAYIAAIALLGLADWRSVFTAATFTNGYSPWGRSELFAQTWSLSIEEQFYLLWPATLFLLGRRSATNVAVGLILVSPLLRVANHFLPVPRYWDIFVLHTRLDGLMFGCCAALLRNNPAFQRWCRACLKPAGAFAAFVFAVAVSPVLTHKLGGAYRLPFGISLETLALLWIVLYFVLNSEGWFGRVLNWRPVAHVGMISYAVYLWQQLLIVGPRNTVWRSFPLNLLLTFALAELSWWTVEAWARRARRNWEHRPHAALAAVTGD